MKKEMPCIFYVYLHKKADTSEPFYVGKGYNNRAYEKLHRSQWWKNIVEKHGYIVEFIATGLSDEEACNLEVETISKIGRRDLKTGPLVNLTDGGEGRSGSVVSEETRAKNAAVWQGRKHSEESKRKISESNRGIQKSEEHRKHISEANSNRVYTKEFGSIMSKALKGVIHKDKGETNLTAEHKMKIRASLSGKTKSPEHRAKLAEASRLSHAKRKLNKNS